MRIRISIFPFIVMAMVLWFVIAMLLSAIVPPMQSLDHGNTFVPDHIALVEAASGMFCVAILSWLLTSIYARKRWFVTIALTWALLAIPFAFIDQWGSFGLFDAVSLLSHVRAFRVMSDGQDLAFQPLLIPVISIFSGLAYGGSLMIVYGFKMAKKA
jgi:hypothetical protein